MKRKLPYSIKHSILMIFKQIFSSLLLHNMKQVTSQTKFFFGSIFKRASRAFSEVRVTSPDYKKQQILITQHIHTVHKPAPRLFPLLQIKIYTLYVTKENICLSLYPTTTQSIIYPDCISVLHRYYNVVTLFVSTKNLCVEYICVKQLLQCNYSSSTIQICVFGYISVLQSSFSRLYSC